MSPLQWRKSTFSAGDAANCVEIAAGPTGTPHLRESTAPAVVIATTPPALRALLSALKAGQWDFTGR
ncbi:DUF397 domain-containing protein [Streptomyces zagrosensis]|uniref:DUF397 domain-containing protein n=1 Tax=Streptomyces zagrosensis TaxID=1042984 RepID=A0A7W9QAM6_9ACTN|nr:DUF397 domain-containing protein [Streptomyces zagrosensis]MBB5936716.1 hypothetical protein [Streptomyces zagrosensis]